MSEHEIHLGPHRKPRVNCQSILDGEQIQYFLFSCIYMQINWLFPIFRCQISWARKLISNQELTPIFHHNGFSVPGERLLPFKWYGNRRTTTDLRQSTLNVSPDFSVQDWRKRTFRAASNVSKYPCMFNWFINISQYRINIYIHTHTPEKNSYNKDDSFQFMQGYI